MPLAVIKSTYTCKVYLDYGWYQLACRACRPSGVLDIPPLNNSPLRYVHIVTAEGGNCVLYVICLFIRFFVCFVLYCFCIDFMCFLFLFIRLLVCLLVLLFIIIVINLFAHKVQSEIFI